MHASIRSRLTYANVMSSIAVFAVLGGGGAWAHGKITSDRIVKGAVTTPKLAKQAVGPGKIKQRAVGTKKIRQKAVGIGKLKDASVGMDQLRNGSVGTDKVVDEAVTTGKLAPAAVEHGKLADGVVTASKLGTVVRRSGPTVNVLAGATETRLTNCQAGEQSLGAGGSWAGLILSGTAANLHIVQTFPHPEGFWTVQVYNGTAAAREFTLHILCLQV